MVALIIALVFFNSPIAIAMTGVITTFISFLVNAHPNKKLINYTYSEQIKDVAPYFAMSLVMLFVVLLVGKLNMPLILLMLVQIIVGIGIYVAMSLIFRVEPFYFVLNLAKSFLKKKK